MIERKVDNGCYVTVLEGKDHFYIMIQDNSKRGMKKLFFVFQYKFFSKVLWLVLVVAVKSHLRIIQIRTIMINHAIII